MKNMFLCYFPNPKTDKIDIINKIISVQRTPALDAVKEAILTRAIIYPIIYGANEEFIEQMTASVRVFNEKRTSQGQVGVYEWREGEKDDHYMLATAYCLIAKRLLALLKR